MGTTLSLFKWLAIFILLVVRQGVSASPFQKCVGAVPIRQWLRGCLSVAQHRPGSSLETASSLHYSQRGEDGGSFVSSSRQCTLVVVVRGSRAYSSLIVVQANIAQSVFLIRPNRHRWGQ